MGRHKILIDESFNDIISEELKQFKDSDVVIKLKAIQATLTHTESLVADVNGVARSTLLRWISIYKKYGIEGLKNKSRGHNPSKLNQEQKDIIREWILSCKDSTGKPVHWTLKRLIKEIQTVFSIEISKTPLWLTMKSMGLSLKKPRPQHHKSDVEKQEDFKKNSRND